ncbi:hypothetical protein N7540_007832 [Penicillium herquei]|nr:hypothetical protein N7540_007832 [Penicillium herquei]
MISDSRRMISDKSHEETTEEKRPEGDGTSNSDKTSSEDELSASDKARSEDELSTSDKASSRESSPSARKSTKSQKPISCRGTGMSRWISDDLQEDLFAHTKRILEGKLLSADPVTPKEGLELQDLLPARNIQYRAPGCINCKSGLSRDVSLKGPTIKRSVDVHRSSTSRGTSSQMIDIVSSRMPSYGKTVLYKADPTDKKQKPQFSWM